jgi:hypothetical protein
MSDAELQESQVKFEIDVEKNNFDHVQYVKDLYTINELKPVAEHLETVRLFYSLLQYQGIDQNKIIEIHHDEFPESGLTNRGRQTAIKSLVKEIEEIEGHKLELDYFKNGIEKLKDSGHIRIEKISTGHSILMILLGSSAFSLSLAFLLNNGDLNCSFDFENNSFEASVKSPRSIGETFQEIAEAIQNLRNNHIHSNYPDSGDKYDTSSSKENTVNEEDEDDGGLRPKRG